MKRPHVNIFSEYSQPTAELLLSLLADAYKDETKLDKGLASIMKDVVEETTELLRSLYDEYGIDLNQKIHIRDYPALFQAVKEIENKEWQKMTEWFWIGYNVITESLARTYENTLDATYEMFLPMVPQARAFIKPKNPEIEIIDSNVYGKIKIPWCQDGKNYSERLWGHVSQFQDKLEFVLETGINKGKGEKWMKWALKELTGGTAYNISCLLKTETVAMWSQATKESYLNMGIEYIEIVGDAACGGVCSGFVGESIPLEGAQLGAELPPYHPNCACSYIAYESEEEEENLDEEDLSI